jgi:hypothetical protein
MELFAMLMDGGMMASEVVRLDDDPGRLKMIHGRYLQAGALLKL